MKAVVFKGPFDVAVENVPDPTIEKPLDAIIRITTSNICGSDLHPYEGRAPLDEGMVLGHENMGVVEEVGQGVDRISVGDRERMSQIQFMTVGYPGASGRTRRRWASPVENARPAVERVTAVPGTTSTTRSTACEPAAGDGPVAAARASVRSTLLAHPSDLEARPTALEARVEEVAADAAAAARHLAAARDRDIADLGVKVDANREAINALGAQTAGRFDRLEQRADRLEDKVDTGLEETRAGFAEMRGTLDQTAAGQQRIADLITNRHLSAGRPVAGSSGRLRSIARPTTVVPALPPHAVPERRATGRRAGTRWEMRDT